MSMEYSFRTSDPWILSLVSDKEFTLNLMPERSFQLLTWCEGVEQLYDRLLSSGEEMKWSDAVSLQPKECCEYSPAVIWEGS